MCGIAGIAGQHALAFDGRRRLARMMALLRHRGPDDEGTWATAHVALGHRRLSIIDLHGGRQPLANEDGRIQTIVNGEIYNYRELRDTLIQKGHHFRSGSDAEVVVHLYEEYGEAFLDQLNGMFAIALWDDRQRKLILARDRLGLKPLYYAPLNGGIVFGSELKAVVAGLGNDHQAVIDLPALHDYLTFGFIPAPRTIFEGVYKLEPGAMLSWQDQRIITRRWWDLRFNGYHTEDETTIAGQLWHEVKTATRARTVADVPLGAFLSSGVDSAAVVACMVDSQHGNQAIKTITCGFDRRDHDESAAARQTAALLGTHHQQRRAELDMLALVDRLAFHFDEPFADASALPLYLICETARRDITVALSGDGGDEVLAGYRRYAFDAFENRLRQAIPKRWHRQVGALGRHWPRHAMLPRFLRAGATLSNVALDAATAHGRSIATLMPETSRGLLTNDAQLALHDYDPLQRVRDLYAACDAHDAVRKCQYVDIRLGLGDGILTKVDRASMAHGLEVRAPLLDYRLVEYAWGITPAQLRERGHGKAPLRRAAAARLNSEIAWRTKSGFDVPLDAWFRKQPRWARARLFDANTPLADIIQSQQVENIWNRHQSGQRNVGHVLWRLLMLQSWAGRFLSNKLNNVSSPAA